MDRPVLIFATRGSIQDGLGHVMRSRAVAEDLAMQGVALKMLILGDESSLALLRHTALDYEYCSSDEELSVRILELHAVCVVFDMLRFDQGCLERIKEQCLTISLSPVFSGLAEMEHMFHRTVHEDPSWADKVRFPKIHKGLQYAIISERCHRISNAVFSRASWALAPECRHIDGRSRCAQSDIVSFACLKRGQLFAPDLGRFGGSVHSLL
jgi:spore coat polysaccharide biosynthesis predicted glycosyltransferase SpsG